MFLGPPAGSLSSGNDEVMDEVVEVEEPDDNTIRKAKHEKRVTTWETLSDTPSYNDDERYICDCYPEIMQYIFERVRRGNDLTFSLSAVITRRYGSTATRHTIITTRDILHTKNLPLPIVWPGEVTCKSSRAKSSHPTVKMTRKR